MQSQPLRRKPISPAALYLCQVKLGQNHVLVNRLADIIPCHCAIIHISHTLTMHWNLSVDRYLTAHKITEVFYSSINLKQLPIFFAGKSVHSFISIHHIYLIAQSTQCITLQPLYLQPKPIPLLPTHCTTLQPHKISINLHADQITHKPSGLLPSAG